MNSIKQSRRATKTCSFIECNEFSGVNPISNPISKTMSQQITVRYKKQKQILPLPRCANHGWGDPCI